MEHDQRRQIFKTVFLDQLKFKTRILVCHQKEFLEQADRVVCLKDGEILASGTLSEVLQIPEVGEILQSSRNHDRSTLHEGKNGRENDNSKWAVGNTRFEESAEAPSGNSMIKGGRRRNNRSNISADRSNDGSMFVG